LAYTARLEAISAGSTSLSPVSMESRLSFVALSSRWCTRRALKPVVMATPRCHLSLWKPARLCDTQLHCWRAPLNLKPLVQVAPRYHHGDTAHYTFHHISPLASTVTGTTSLQHIPVVPAAKMWPSRGGLPVVSRCSRCSQRLVAAVAATPPQILDSLEKACGWSSV
jgi:hypothetical protein